MLSRQEKFNFDLCSHLQNLEKNNKIKKDYEQSLWRQVSSILSLKLFTVMALGDLWHCQT